MSIAFGVASCLSDPRFETQTADGQIDDAMVLIDRGPARELLRDDDDDDAEEEARKGRRKGGSGRSDAPEDGPSAPEAGAPNRDPPTAPPPTVPFWIDMREVAQRDFAVCVRSRVCTPAACAAPSPEHPVACVTRDQARTYCAWRKKRLVRDEEWSRAAGVNTYPWGNAGPSAMRLHACGDPDACTTAPRGAHPEGATREGVLDLAGNVAEWVDANVSTVRGGSFADADPASFASSSRRMVDAFRADPTIGFRCARDP
jgi:formylglycine-generating enzyme required for sulfatase activity